eukprot:1391751-Amorphochlora_amoeboformis.AAC.1
MRMLPRLWLQPDCNLGNRFKILDASSRSTCQSIWLGLPSPAGSASRLFSRAHGRDLRLRLLSGLSFDLA